MGRINIIELIASNAIKLWRMAKPKVERLTPKAK
jgi:hypothetical protein